MSFLKSEINEHWPDTKTSVQPIIGLKNICNCLMTVMGK